MRVNPQNPTNQMTIDPLVLVYLPYKATFDFVRKKKARRSLPLLYWPGGLGVHHVCVLVVSAGRGASVQEQCCLGSCRYLW